MRPSLSVESLSSKRYVTALLLKLKPKAEPREIYSMIRKYLQNRDVSMHGIKCKRYLYFCNILEDNILLSNISTIDRWKRMDVRRAFRSNRIISQSPLLARGRSRADWKMKDDRNKEHGFQVFFDGVERITGFYFFSLFSLLFLCPSVCPSQSDLFEDSWIIEQSRRSSRLANLFSHPRTSRE